MQYELSIFILICVLRKAYSNLSCTSVKGMMIHRIIKLVGNAITHYRHR